ncbi:glycoside hydrolase family 15 protein [Nocardia sp. CA-129566]|uniref:glycoside hydrolase family 15 protein n=1 Tax=Nocardia sp. CA-129566 TaxID=3239976 RepID=UPI003D95FAE3
MTAEKITRPHVLREYAFLADGERGVLVGPHGDFAWMCAPRWHSDAVFAALVGGDGGYSVTPSGRYVWGGYYQTGTLIWNSHWLVGSSVVECREALAFPGDPHRAVVLRRIVAVHGDAEVDVVLRPAGQFGEARARDLHRTADGWWLARVGDLALRWTGGASASVCDGCGWIARITLRQGEIHDLVLELSDIALPDEPPDPNTAWAQTESAWQRGVPKLGPCAASRDTAQAYAVMRGMTSSTNGMVAAATTSLPERADRGENYDYRYVWIRDQCFAGQAVAADGPHPLLDNAIQFVGDRLLTDGPEVLPACTVTGRSIPEPSSLDLPGYPGGRTVVGNRVRRQSQLDVFGEALLLFAAGARHDRLTEDSRKAVSVAVGAIAERWRRPDAGIWEIEDRHWTHSRLTCVSGLRAVAAVAPTGADPVFCTALADTIMAETARTSVHPGGAWQQAPDAAGVDAALLLPAIRGGIPVDDPRSLATYRAVERELCTDYYVYRFRHDEQPLETNEGAFLFCGFIMAIAAAQLGHRVSAARYFERNRAACGTPGLFAEEFDVRQRQLRGNMPQAFVHAMLFESSVRLTRFGDDQDKEL